MKVLFITTKTTEYIRNTQEIRMLQEQGHQVEVLASEKGSYPKRLLEIYGKLLVKSLKGYDEIFIGFEPQLVVPVFGWKLRGKKVTVDFFISVYDTMVNDRKKFRPGSPLAGVARLVDTVTYRRADHIIADTKADAAYFAEEFGKNHRSDQKPNRQKKEAPEKSVQVLYLEADTAIYNEEISRQAYGRRPEKLRGKYVVLYFGSVLPLQGVGVILDALRRLKEHQELFFYMIGPLGKKIEPVRADNIEYIDWLPQDQLAEYIGYADLCLAGHFDGEIDKARRTIPGKTYIYRSMGKPVVLGDSEANHELFEEGQPGVYFTPMGDGAALAGTILKARMPAKGDPEAAPETGGQEELI